MNKEEAIKRIKIWLEDECDCPECLKNKEAYRFIKNYLENSIPTQVILDKIEEIDNILNKGGIDYSTKVYARCKKRVLQEILNKGENNNDR